MKSYDFERQTRLNDEISMRRHIINDLMRNDLNMENDYPMSVLMNMNLFDLHTMIEQRKLETKMNTAAMTIQRKIR